MYELASNVQLSGSEREIGLKCTEIGLKCMEIGLKCTELASNVQNVHTFEAHKFFLSCDLSEPIRQLYI